MSSGYLRNLLVVMTLEGTKAKVLIQGTTTESFDIRAGVRQGDELSTTIFNLVLHYAMKDLYRGGHIMSKSYQILAYADDVTICVRSMRSMIDTFVNLEKRTKKVGLKINENKTKYLKVSKNTIKVTQRNISMAGYSIEIIQNFIYLSAYLNSKNSMHEEIMHRIMSANSLLS